MQRGHNVQIQRLADGTGFLGAVQHRDLFHRLGQRGDQMFCRERTIEVYLHQTNLFASGVQIVDGLFSGLADRAHCDDHPLGVSGAVIVEQLVFGADLGVDLIHIIFGYADDRVIIFIAGLAHLEEDIRVLRRTALRGMLRIQRAAAELVHRVFIQHIIKVLIVPHLDLLHLMRGSETVKEM